MELFLLIWLLFGVSSAAIASSKGRNGCAWGCLGVLFGPFAFIVAVLPSTEEEARTKAVTTGSSEAFKKCPYCAEAIRREAIKCRYCGSDIKRDTVHVTPEMGRQCPSCGETIHSESITCRHCGSFVDPA